VTDGMSETQSEPTELAGDARWMSEVLAEAAAAVDDGELPIAAIVVAGGHEVARARALDAARGNRTSHAEILAITGARLSAHRSQGLTLYATLEPCVMCSAAALIEGFSRVVYALAAPEDGGTFLFDETHVRARCFGARRPEVVAGCCAAEAAELFAGYARRWPERRVMAEFARAVAEAWQGVGSG